MPKLDVLQEEKRGWVEFIRGWAELERVVHVVRKGGRVARLEEAAREAEVGLVKLQMRVEMGGGSGGGEETWWVGGRVDGDTKLPPYTSWSIY